MSAACRCGRRRSRSRPANCKVDLDRLDERLADNGFVQLPITWTHVRQLRHLPALHRDPFDRMLIAQAISEPLHLLTHDAALAAYSDLVTFV